MYRESANYLSEFGTSIRGSSTCPASSCCSRGSRTGRRSAGPEDAGGVFGRLGAAAAVRASRTCCSTTVMRRRTPHPPLPPPGDVSARVRTRPRRRCCLRAVAGGHCDVERRRDGSARRRAAGARARVAGDAGRRAGRWSAALAFGVGDGPVRLGAGGGAAAVGAGARLLAGAPAGAPPRGAADRRRRGRHAGRAAAVGHPPRAPERLSCISPTITAASPRSSAPIRTRKGRYTRALNRMFKDVTGRSVLDEPHRRDRSRRLRHRARVVSRSSPRYALGLAVMKADRLFDPEHRLLYWSIFRPGRSGRSPGAHWFAAHRDAITGSRTVSASRSSGSRWRVSPRPWRAGAGRCWRWCRSSSRWSRRTRLFFAEPRYRLPIEMLAFPFVALALGGDRRRAGVAGGAPLARGLVHAARALGAGAGAGRRLARRPGPRCSTGHRPARAPPLGGHRGRARRAQAPAALGAGAAAGRAVAAGRVTGGRPRPHATATRRPSRAAPAPRRRPAAGRALRVCISGWRPRPARRAFDLAGAAADGRPVRLPRWTPEVTHPGGPLDAIRNHRPVRRADRSGSAKRRSKPCDLMERFRTSRPAGTGKSPLAGRGHVNALRQAGSG